MIIIKNKLNLWSLLSILFEDTLIDLSWIEHTIIVIMIIIPYF